MTTLKISDIRTDGGTQVRDGVDNAIAAEYAAAMQAGAKFPPVDVFHDGTSNWLANGFHRVAGAKLAGLDSLEATIRTGTQRDAILFACGANADHGLRRTNADKRRAVERLIKDDEWGKKSNRWIAEKCGVSDPFVGSTRSQLQPQEITERSERTLTVSSAPPKLDLVPDPPTPHAKVPNRMPDEVGLSAQEINRRELKKFEADLEKSAAARKAFEKSTPEDDYEPPWGSLAVEGLSDEPAQSDDANPAEWTDESVEVVTIAGGNVSTSPAEAVDEFRDEHTGDAEPAADWIKALAEPYIRGRATIDSIYRDFRKAVKADPRLATRTKYLLRALEDNLKAAYTELGMQMPVMGCYSCGDESTRGPGCHKCSGSGYVAKFAAKQDGRWPRRAA